jgi:hypothetical protein
VVEARPQPGLRQVLQVAVAVVAVVLGAAIVTDFLPTSVQSTIFHAPVLIVVLVVGTAWLLWRISRDRGGRSDGAVTAPTSPAASEPEDRVERR